MAKRGLGKTSGRQGSRPDTLDPVVDAETRTGPIARSPGRELPPEAAASALEAQELQEPHAPATDEARLLTDFFSVPPPAPQDVELDEPVHAVRAPRAMWLSLGMLSLSVVAIGSYLAYQELYVPQAVELGSDEPVLVLEGPSGMGLPGEPVQAEAPEAVSGGSTNTEVSLAAATDDQLAPAPTLVIEGSAEPAAAEPAAVAADALALAEPPRADGTSAPGSGTLSGSASPEPTAPQPAAADGTPLEQAPAGQEPGRVGQLAAAAGPDVPQPTAAVEGASDSAPLTAAGAAQVVGSVAQAAAAGPVQSFDELLEQAEGLSRRGQSVQAVAAFERALQRQPGASAALAGKAYAYLNLNDQRSAKALAEQAVAADPTSSRGWIVLGAAEEQLGSRSAAQAAYRQCAQRGVGHYVDECRKLVR